MPYKVSFRPAAWRQFAKLPKTAQQRLRPKIDALQDNPRPAGVERLKGGKGLHRLRVGEYRIIYQIRQAALQVLVVRVGHRREVYQRISGLD